MNTRILTVSAISPYEDKKGRFVLIPIIRLQGKWLEELGFCPGCKVQVLEYKNKIILTLVKEDF